jgi:hypothetical protein
MWFMRIGSYNGHTFTRSVHPARGLCGKMYSGHRSSHLTCFSFEHDRCTHRVNERCRILNQQLVVCNASCTARRWHARWSSVASGQSAAEGAKTVIFQKSVNWYEPRQLPCKQHQCECAGGTRIAQPHGLARSRHFHFDTRCAVRCGTPHGEPFLEAVRGPSGTRWCGGARRAEWAQWPSAQRPGPAGPLRGLQSTSLASHAARTRPGPATDRLPDLEIFAVRGLEAWT